MGETKLRLARRSCEGRKGGREGGREVREGGERERREGRREGKVIKHRKVNEEL